MLVVVNCRSISPISFSVPAASAYRPMRTKFKKDDPYLEINTIIIIEFKKYDEPDLSVQNYVIRNDIVPKTLNLRKDEFHNGKL